MLDGSARSTRWAVAPSSERGHGSGARLVDVADRHPGAERGEVTADGRADAARAAGHHRSAAAATRATARLAGQLRRRQTSWLRYPSGPRGLQGGAGGRQSDTARHPLRRGGAGVGRAPPGPGAAPLARAWPACGCMACGVCGTDLHLLHGMVLPAGAPTRCGPATRCAASSTRCDRRRMPPARPRRSRRSATRSCSTRWPPAAAASAAPPGRDHLCAQRPHPRHRVPTAAWPTRSCGRSTGSSPSTACRRPRPRCCPTPWPPPTTPCGVAALPPGGTLCVLGAGGIGTHVLQLARVLDPGVRLAAVVRSRGDGRARAAPRRRGRRRPRRRGEGGALPGRRGRRRHRLQRRRGGARGRDLRMLGAGAARARLGRRRAAAAGHGHDHRSSCGSCRWSAPTAPRSSDLRAVAAAGHGRPARPVRLGQRRDAAGRSRRPRWRSSSNGRPASSASCSSPERACRPRRRPPDSSSGPPPSAPQLDLGDLRPGALGQLVEQLEPFGPACAWPPRGRRGSRPARRARGWRPAAARRTRTPARRTPGRGCRRRRPRRPTARPRCAPRPPAG